MAAVFVLFSFGGAGGYLSVHFGGIFGKTVKTGVMACLGMITEN